MIKTFWLKLNLIGLLNDSYWSQMQPLYLHKLDSWPDHVLMMQVVTCQVKFDHLVLKKYLLLKKSIQKDKPITDTIKAIITYTCINSSLHW